MSCFGTKGKGALTKIPFGPNPLKKGGRRLIEGETGETRQ
jgi:hypothetical protein